MSIPRRRLPDDVRQGRFERVVIPAIAVAYAVGLPVWSLGRVLDGPHRPSVAIAALVATACSVVLQLCLLVPMARAARPRHAGWLIAAFAVINIAVFPLIGVLWFAAGEQLAVLVAVYLHPRWSVPIIAALVAAPAAVAIAGHDVMLARYFAQNTGYWALTIGVPIWLAAIAARLRASRQDLAGSAVVAERVRIDDELGTSLGVELAQLIAVGQRAALVAVNDPAAATSELRALTGASRTALSKTRRMVSRYQAITVRAELGTAVALLAAAGVPARVEVPPAVLGQALDKARLAPFRAGLATVLDDEEPRGCVIGSDGHDGDLRLTISRES